MDGQLEQHCVQLDYLHFFGSRSDEKVQFPNFCRPLSWIRSFYLVIDQLFISSLWLQSGVNINGDNTSKTTWRTCFGIKSEINNLI